MALSRADTSVIGRWWWSVDRVTLVALAVLIGIGYVLALAATPGLSMHVTDPHTMAMIRQILFLALGGAVMLAMSMLSLLQVITMQHPKCRRQTPSPPAAPVSLSRTDRRQCRSRQLNPSDVFAAGVALAYLARRSEVLA